MSDSTVDLDRLLKLRVAVARVGEMDLAKWWNTQGQLGRLGTATLRRGFPRTHYLAQGAIGLRCRGVPMPGGLRPSRLCHPLELAGGDRGGVRGMLGALARPSE